MFTINRYLGVLLGLLLLRWCAGTLPPPPAAAQKTAPAVRPATPAARPAPPLADLLRVLLDTAAAGSARAADARLGLQAGAEVRLFYGAAYQPAWAAPASLTSAAQAALALLAQAPAHGLPADYGGPRLRALRDSLAAPASLPLPRAQQQARFDLYLSDAALRFMRDVSRGRLRPYAWSARERAAGRAWPAAAGLRAALAAGAGEVPAALLAGQPANREYRLLQQALGRWLAQPVAPDSAARHRAQYERAALNLERWRWEAWPPEPGDYVLVNLPAFELQLVAHDSVRSRHRVVVGKPQTPTPTLSSHITYFTLAPDWHAPRSIAVKEFLPRLQKNARYLALNNLALYDQRGRQLDPTRIAWRTVTARSFAYEIRQAPGCDNALGDIVFRFPNPYAVYLHDTPMRQFFEQPRRAFSHGCIRLAEPMQLAAYLLRREGRSLALPSPAQCARQPRPRTVQLRQPLPLHVCYATCAAEAGQLHFFEDVYQRDEAVRRGLFGNR